MLILLFLLCFIIIVIIIPVRNRHRIDDDSTSIWCFRRRFDVDSIIIFDWNYSKSIHHIIVFIFPFSLKQFFVYILTPKSLYTQTSFILALIHLVILLPKEYINIFKLRRKRAYMIELGRTLWGIDISKAHRGGKDLW